MLNIKPVDVETADFLWRENTQIYYKGKEARHEPKEWSKFYTPQQASLEDDGPKGYKTFMYGVETE